MEKKVIPGLKLIKHNASRVDLPDDPSFPFRLDLSLRPPEFMSMAFLGLIGSTEELVVRGMTQEALGELIERNHFRTHPRLRHMTVTGPDGVVEQVPQ